MILFFAGAEKQKVAETLYANGVRNVLVSFFYLKNKDTVEYLLSHFDRVALDSGAFTMFHASEASTRQEHQAYVKKYLSFIEQYMGRFFYVANYDVNALVGDTLVTQWNKEFEALETVGQKVCFVAHDYTVPYRILSAYAERYSYIGVSGDEKNDKTSVRYFSQVMQLSKKYGCKVHGFAQTNFVSFLSFPLFSVDSTTYLGGARYGSTYVFNGAFFETVDFKHKYYRKQYIHWCDRWGIDREAFLHDDQSAVLPFNIRMWLENEKTFNRKTAYRQWWLTDAERTDYLTARHFCADSGQRKKEAAQ